MAHITQENKKVQEYVPGMTGMYWHTRDSVPGFEWLAAVPLTLCLLCRLQWFHRESAMKHNLSTGCIANRKKNLFCETIIFFFTLLRKQVCPMYAIYVGQVST